MVCDTSIAEHDYPWEPNAFQLSTPNLILRSFRESDAGPLARIYNDPIVRKSHSGNADDGRVWEEIDVRATFHQNEILRHQGKLFYLVIALKESPDFPIGVCSLRKARPSVDGLEVRYEDFYEMGVILGSDYFGNHYGTEVTKRLVEYGFDTLQAAALQFLTIHENGAMKRILENMGVVHVRRVDQTAYPNQTFDLFLMARTRWNSLKSR